MFDEDIVLTLLRFAPVLFVMALGSCVGSLINVLVYRLPRGEDIVLPSSRCPSCQTKLTWRENIPIFGWLFLKGRCRFCRTKISAEYPIVEAAVALMFGLVWIQLYLLPQGWEPFGIEIWRLSPEWARNGWEQTWPIYLCVVGLFSGLFAMTVIDARTFMIPMVLPIACTVLGVFVHTAWGMFIDFSNRPGQLLQTAGAGWFWAIPHAQADTYVPGIFLPAAETGKQLQSSGWWWWIGACGGAVVGTVLSNLLMRYGIIRQSFLDYPTWEEATLKKQAEEAAALATAAGQDPAQASKAAQMPDDPTQLWTAYPYARREMIKEMAFLALPVLLALVGGYIAVRATAVQVEQSATQIVLSVSEATPPYWLFAASASVMGYFLVAGVLWLIRILGTLGFGKEALGMGDIHLMGAVGACLGWIDGIWAFFLSAPVALIGWLVGFVLAKMRGQDKASTLPFGPWLSIATVLVFVGKPGLEWVWTRLSNSTERINWP
jgi:leader peptidase (prepilin peptidase) / N-methyltransferase